MRILSAAGCLGVLLAMTLSGCSAGGEEGCFEPSCAAQERWPEGGEVRLGHISLPDGSELRYVIAFFLDAQRPVAEEPTALGGCFEEPVAEPAERRYRDVGEGVTYVMGDQELTAPRYEDARDFIGRNHGIVYLTETDVPTTPGFFDSMHAVRTGEEQPFSGLLTSLYMPPRFEVLYPQGPGIIPVEPGEDLVVEWQHEVAPSAAVSARVLFLRDDQGLGPIVCLGPDTGRLVVPAEAVDGLLPDGGIMQLMLESRSTVETDEGRTIHLVGTASTAYPWTKVD